MALLLQAGANTLIEDHSGTSVLDAANRCDEYCFDVLLEHICRVGADNETSDSPSSNMLLFLVAKHAQDASVRKVFELAEFLFKRGADPNTLLTSDGRQYTPLCMAAECGIFDLCNWLLKRGASPNIDGVYDSPLALTIRNNHVNVVKLLLLEGADPDDIGTSESDNEKKREARKRRRRRAQLAKTAKREEAENMLALEEEEKRLVAEKMLLHEEEERKKLEKEKIHSWCRKWIRSGCESGKRKKGRGCESGKRKKGRGCRKGRFYPCCKNRNPECLQENEREFQEEQEIRWRSKEVNRKYTD